MKIKINLKNKYKNIIFKKITLFLNKESKNNTYLCNTLYNGFIGKGLREDFKINGLDVVSNEYKVIYIDQHFSFSNEVTLKSKSYLYIYNIINNFKKIDEKLIDSFEDASYELIEDFKSKLTNKNLVDNLEDDKFTILDYIQKKLTLKQIVNYSKSEIINLIIDSLINQEYDGSDYILIVDNIESVYNDIEIIELINRINSASNIYFICTSTTSSTTKHFVNYQIYNHNYENIDLRSLFELKFIFNQYLKEESEVNIENYIRDNRQLITQEDIRYILDNEFYLVDLFSYVLLGYDIDFIVEIFMLDDKDLESFLNFIS